MTTAGRRASSDLVGAFLAGAATLLVETAIVRATAPWFGQGPYVWANAVGVVLLALALGSLLGARWSARDPRGASLPFALAAAAVWFAVASRFVGPLSAWLVPIDVAPDRPLPLSLWGSLVATLVVAGPPVVVLGAVPPLLVSRSVGERGRRVGAISAIGTVGAVVGCVAGPIVVPALGSRGAIALAGLATAVAAICVVRPAVRGAPADVPGTSSLPARPRAGLAPIVVVAIVGLCTTVLEFTAFRALTPVAGGTNATFSAVIAAALLACAAGAAWGGGSPAEGRDVRRAQSVLGPAMIACVVGTGALGGLARSLGPFLATFLAYGPPLFALSALVPVVVRRFGAHAGNAAGLAFGASTAAALVGCYATPLVLLPDVGVRWTSYSTLLVAALAAAAVRVVLRRVPPVTATATDTTPERVIDALVRPSSSVARAVVPGVAVLVASIALAIPAGPLRVDRGQVDEVETAYQTMRAVDEQTLAIGRGRHPLFGTERFVATRSLRFDEDVGSYQSVRLLEDEGALLSGGRYYEHLAVGAFLERMPWTGPSGDPRVLIVGYCGGTLHRVLSLVTPLGRAGPDVVGIELDPAVGPFATTHLGAMPPRLTLLEGRDGRRVVDEMAAAERFDLIFVDAYQRTQYVPFQLATIEFFRSCRSRLTSDGAIGINMNSPGGLGGRLVQSVAATLRAAMGDGVWLVPNPHYPTNVVVWATLGRRPPRLARDVPATLTTPAFAFERFLVRATTTARELTDDRAPVEELADETLLPVEGAR